MLFSGPDVSLPTAFAVTSISAVVWRDWHFVSPKNMFLSGRKWRKFHAGVEDAGMLNVPAAWEGGGAGLLPPDRVFQPLLQGQLWLSLA